VRTLLEDDLPPLQIGLVRRGKIAEASAGELT